MMKACIRALLVAYSLIFVPAVALAEEGPSYKPAIWIDPDGCEHWVLDLGVEGMMSPHLDRDGRPVCNRNPNICMEFPGDLLFESGKAVLTPTAVDRLREYFSGQIASGTSHFLIVGHTDSVGSIYDNFDLAWARAKAVADIGRFEGAVVRTDAFGEFRPIASNETEDGRRRNRRVEIFCE